MAISKGQAQGAGTVAGAGIGTVFGPLGTMAGGALGGIAGGLIYDAFEGDPVQEAEKEKMRQMQMAADSYAAYRPQVHQANQQGLIQQLSAMNGANNTLGMMYGAKYNPQNYAPNLARLPNADMPVSQQIATLGRR
jgi:hypothetical protein